MNKIDIIAMAFRNFMRRKSRSILTISGVVIGVTAIVVMISIGIGLTESMEAQYASWSDLTMIEVYAGWSPEGSKSMDASTIASFEALDGVLAASPYKYFNGKLVSGRYVGYANIIGIDASKAELMGFKVTTGRTLQEGDLNQVMVGQDTVYNFYDTRKKDPYAFDPNEEYDEYGRPKPKVSLEEDKFKLTFDWSYGEKNPNSGGDGVVAKKPKLYNLEVVGTMGNDTMYSYQTFGDINYLTKIYKEYLRSTGASQNELKSLDTFDQIYVKVESTDVVLDLLEEIKGMGYEAYSPVEYIESSQEQMMIIQMVLGGIGGISLLVAAIGIANTMVMSIYERTREIGIMKVLGCKLSDIRNLFLYEAGIIGITGGTFGLALSYLLSYLLNMLSGTALGSIFGGGPGSNISIIPLWLAAAAVMFAIFVGLASGFYPARRAMKLSALDAIKTE